MLQCRPRSNATAEHEDHPIAFTVLTGFTAPNPQQAIVGETDLDAQVVILEAETGSGKTEAALWHYMRLFETRNVDSLYFAVPTRAAAVQLHRRVVNAAKRVFGEASSNPILAVPGYVKAGEVGEPRYRTGACCGMTKMMERKRCARAAGPPSTRSVISPLRSQLEPSIRPCSARSP